VNYQGNVDQLDPEEVHMKWRYGIVKTYPSPDAPEWVLCEVYFDEDPLKVTSYTERGTTFVVDECDSGRPAEDLIKWLDRALEDCRKYPVFDSADLIVRN
jgi:hypothetical protein